MSETAAQVLFWVVCATAIGVTSTLWLPAISGRLPKPQVAATYDWAMLEALEEVDRIGWAAPSVAPSKRDPRNTGLAMMQANAWQVHVAMTDMRYAVLYANAPELRNAMLMANQVAQADLDAQIRIRGQR